jgi:hypothetical protein
MKYNKVISFNKKLIIIFFIIFLFLLLFKTKNSYFVNKQLKVINYKQINSNHSLLKINKNKNSLKLFKKYFNICNKLIRFNNKNTIIDKYPFISICIPVYKIRLINHYKNAGVYNSRIEAALNANGKYILFLDPDDMILNQYLFEYLYNYSTFYNLDIIEFLVYHKEENQNYIYYPKNTAFNHNHNFNNSIIYQPELSDIIFFEPNTKKYNGIICRTIWNKIYRRELLLKTIDYIGEEYYYNNNLIIADDTILNIMNFHFAKNYSNIKIVGYLYNKREISMSRGFMNKKHRIKQDISFYLYFKLLYKYIKDFDKDRNFMYNEINTNRKRIIEFKKLNISDYIEKVKFLLYEIKNDDKSSELLKNLIHKLLLKLN